MRWLILLSILFLSACANTTQFGVQEEVWARMTEAERLEAIRGYNERKRLQEENAQRAAEERRIAERHAALAREAKRLEDAELARQAALAREERIRAIHEGNRRPGDLIRVSLQSGLMRVGGRHREFAPLAFSLASGESMQIEVHSRDPKHMNYMTKLFVTYDDGLLVIDGNPNNKRESRAGRLTYEPEWRRGVRYRLDSEGPLELRDVEVLVSTLELRGQRH